MPRPPRTYDGRTSTGKPISAAISWACANDDAMPCLGAGSPASASSRPKAPRSSARWIAAGEVPTIGTPASSSPCASPSGVCPPSWQMTPAIGPASDSACTISSTSSSVSGSK